MHVVQYKQQLRSTEGAKHHAEHLDALVNGRGRRTSSPSSCRDGAVHPRAAHAVVAGDGQPRPARRRAQRLRAAAPADGAGDRIRALRAGGPAARRTSSPRRCRRSPTWRRCSTIASSRRLRRSTRCRSELTAPWGMTLAAMPGYLWFHVVTFGRVLLETDELGATCQPGRAGTRPTRQRHALRSDPGSRRRTSSSSTLEHPSDRYEAGCSSRPRRASRD
jgi:hypothetical protein